MQVNQEEEDIPTVIPDHSENLEPGYARRLCDPRGDSLLAYWRNNGFGMHVRNPSRRPPPLSWDIVELICEEFGRLVNELSEDPQDDTVSQEEKDGYRASFSDGIRGREFGRPLPNREARGMAYRFGQLMGDACPRKVRRTEGHNMISTHLTEEEIIERLCDNFMKGMQSDPLQEEE